MSSAELLAAFPAINFQPGKTFVWAPGKRVVYYDPEKLDEQNGLLALLHEVGHALLDHQTYEFDVELINMEVEAWNKARQLAQNHDLKIDENHINACLETYRIWLYKRSRCPGCGNTSLQQTSRLYSCFLCGTKWKVAQSYTLQPRRMKCLAF